jgi:hypothetical protein
MKGRLSPQEVNQLDRGRREGDLHLTVVHILSFHFTDPPSEHSEFGRVAGFARIKVPRSHRTDNVYPGLGGREIFVVEIPKGPHSIERAWSKVEDAKQAFSNWSTEGTMIACREAAEVLEDTMRDHFGKDSCMYEQRWKRASNGLKDQASLGGHFERIRGNANCEPHIFFGDQDVHVESAAKRVPTGKVLYRSDSTLRDLQEERAQQNGGP